MQRFHYLWGCVADSFLSFTPTCECNAAVYVLVYVRVAVTVWSSAAEVLVRVLICL